MGHMASHPPAVQLSLFILQTVWQSSVENKNAHDMVGMTEVAACVVLLARVGLIEVVQINILLPRVNFKLI